MEGAALWGVDGAGYVAGEDDALSGGLDYGVGDGYGGEKCSGVRVLGVLVELIPAGYLDDLAQVHYRDSVGDVPHDRQVVGDEEVGEVEALLEGTEQVDDLGLNGDVESGDGLVADDEGRVYSQRAGNANPLALAAAELVGVAVHHVGIEAHDLEQLLHPGLTLVAVANLVDDEGFFDYGADGHAGVQGAVGVLEDDLKLFPEGTHCPAGELGEVLAPEADFTAGGPEELEDAPADGGLAAAAFADEAERLAAHDLEGHAVDGLDCAHLRLEYDALADGEVHLQVTDIEEDVGVGVDHNTGSGVRRATSTRHAAECPGRFSSRSGSV